MATNRKPARCGTLSGARRHVRLDEKPCNACARAKSEYDARWRSGTVQQRRNRMHARAQTRAMRTLKQRYPEEYRELYEKAKADLERESAELVRAS